MHEIVYFGIEEGKRTQSSFSSTSRAAASRFCFSSASSSHVKSRTMNLVVSAPSPARSSEPFHITLVACTQLTNRQAAT